VRAATSAAPEMAPRICNTRKNTQPDVGIVQDSASSPAHTSVKQWECARFLCQSTWS
jgi:hypothetical protein